MAPRSITQIFASHINFTHIYKISLYSPQLPKTWAIKAEFYARGKVLLSSEYFVLFGAKALALPSRFGQKMKVQELNGSEILWNSYDDKGKKWFSAEIDLLGFDVVEATDPQTGKYLRKILKACCQNNSEFLSHWKKYKVDHYLEFPLDWGLGSSSTLIYNMALWADVNPYHLYFDVESGSGYDVACAGASGPLLYALGDGEIDLEQVDFKPNFGDKLYFVVLNHKTDSREAVEFAKKNKPPKEILQKASDLTEKLLDLKSLDQFENWVRDHENLLSDYLKIEKIKDGLFRDFWGEVKSLGAWGGDLALITSNKSREETESYFSNKGYQKLIPYRDLVL
ncbi:MAG: GHMP kinase [Saprospiraceae bacterium]|nr:GHMP kinase [Saprospiraceae bacterium]